MPPWMQVLSQINPMTYAIDATRSLVVNGWDWGLVGAMVAVLLVFDFVALLLSTSVLRRELS